VDGGGDFTPRAEALPIAVEDIVDEETAHRALKEATSKGGPISTHYVDVPHTRVGQLIGANGRHLSFIQQRTGCKLYVNQSAKDFADGEPREMVITGTKEQVGG
jgi:predicted PilT family ATPase